MTGFKSKKAAALDEDGMYLVHHTVQEPVAFINAEQRTFEWARPTSWHTPTVVNLSKIPLYTAPPQRPWVDLTADMIEDLFQSAAGADEETHIRFARAIEQSLKEKNT